MSKYQLSYKRFDKLVIIKITYLYGKLSTKLLAETAHENTKFMFPKTGWLHFSELW